MKQQLNLSMDEIKLVESCKKAGFDYWTKISSDDLLSIGRRFNINHRALSEYKKRPEVSLGNNFFIIADDEGYINITPPKNENFQEPVFPIKIFNEKSEPKNMNSENQTPHNYVMGDYTIDVPTKDPLFVPFGIYEDLERIIAKDLFHPVYITGLSGNGKTFSVEQACAQHNKPYVRVPITVESDEDSLLGGFRLINGTTKFQLGPIPAAMEAGAKCLLDEVDKASSKIMCLQPVLEGNPIYLKKINKLIVPRPGFNIIATANTKGQGSELGTFVTSLVLDEAFLERFAVTFEQDYPPVATEKKILTKLLKSYNITADPFVKALVEWAENTRKAYKEGALSSVIATRRLTHIIKNYVIFDQDPHKAVKLAISRFDVATRTAFEELFVKIMPKSTNNFTDATKNVTFSNDTDDRPF